MLDIAIIIFLVLFFQYIVHRDQREYREFRYWKKQCSDYCHETKQEPEPVFIRPNDPNVIDLDKRRKAK